MPKNEENFGSLKQSDLTEERIRKLVSATLKVIREDLRKDRSQVAAELTEIVGFSVSKHMLNDWARESHKGHRTPLSVIRALCEISGRNELAFEAMPGDLRENAKLGEAVRPIIEKWAAKQQEKSPTKRSRTKGGRK